MSDTDGATSSVLDGIRVLDLSRRMPGALAAMVLADYGAEVVKVEAPDGDPSRSHDAWQLWNRGKRSVVADLRTDSDRAALHELIRGADVLIENFRPGVADHLGVGYEEARALQPGLVHCSITGFGPRGPYSRLKGYEGIVNAKTGRMLEFGGVADRDGPGYVAVPSASTGAAHGALQGVLVGLLRRERDGVGSRVETSLLQGNTAYDMLRWIAYQRAQGSALARDRLASWGAMRQQIPRPNYLTAVTKDGVWLQFANTMPHVFMSQMRALGLVELYEDPRFADLPAVHGNADAETVWEAVIERVRSRTWADWQPIFAREPNMSVEPLVATEDAFDHPQVRHNGHIVQVGDTEQVGPLVRLPATPAVAPRPAPQLGADQELLATPWSPREAPEPLRAVAERPALEGTTVVDFATYYASPFGTSLLADYGARVIKVEPVEGDYSRYTAGRLLYWKTTGGKESLAVDLKTDAGREIIHRLLSRADVVLHNFRPGVPERLGVSYEEVRALNPNVVYHYGASYGDTGPYAARPAFHPTAGAISGNAQRQLPPGVLAGNDADLPFDELKRRAWRYMAANEGNPDVNAALGVGSSLLLGLLARERRGVGQYQVTTMICSNLYANADRALRYPGKPPATEADAMLLGTGPLHRLYAAADDSWVFLAAESQREWEALCGALGESERPTDPRFATADARTQHAEALSELLAARFTTQPADDWERLLADHDVACVRADANTVATFAVDDPSNRELGFTVEVEHPALGRYARHGPLMTIEGAAATIGPACEVGEHSRALLSELGYEEATATTLRAAGAVGWPEDDQDADALEQAAVARAQGRSR